MKKVFVVRRTDKISYDEYDSCVIIADSLEEVEKILNTKNKPLENGRWLQYWDKGEREIEEIDLSICDSMEVVASFNAG